MWELDRSGMQGELLHFRQEAEYNCMTLEEAEEHMLALGIESSINDQALGTRAHDRNLVRCLNEAGIQTPNSSRRKPRRSRR